MSTRRVAFNVIVAGIDFSEIAPLVVQRAIEAARGMNAGQVHFVHVHPGPEIGSSRARQCEKLGVWIETQLTRHDAMPPGAQVLVHETSGAPAHCIVELADKLHAGCILVGARACDGGGSSTLLGSVAKAVVRDAECPVLVVRSQNNSGRTAASMARAFA